MATIINNPSGAEGDGGASAVVLAVIVGVLILGGLFVMYRLPALQGDGAGAGSGTTVEVPDKVQIDVNSGGAGAGAGANDANAN